MHVLRVLARIHSRSYRIMPAISTLIVAAAILIGILVSCIYDDWAALVPVALGAVLAFAVICGAIYNLLTW